jgi:hypothetical protein
MDHGIGFDLLAEVANTIFHTVYRPLQSSPVLWLLGLDDVVEFADTILGSQQSGLDMSGSRYRCLDFVYCLNGFEQEVSFLSSDHPV